MLAAGAQGQCLARMLVWRARLPQPQQQQLEQKMELHLRQQQQQERQEAQGLQRQTVLVSRTMLLVFTAVLVFDRCTRFFLLFHYWSILQGRS